MSGSVLLIEPSRSFSPQILVDFLPEFQYIHLITNLQNSQEAENFPFHLAGIQPFKRLVARGNPESQTPCRYATVFYYPSPQGGKK